MRSQARAKEQAVAVDDENTLRLMISSDNHLGVWERDEVRKNDSFAAFEEVLQRAVELRVDMVLLGGDLFHENKPSRNSVVKAIAALKTHCLTPRPIKMQIMSDRAKAFVGGVVNYEDDRLAVGLPVFTIHGNHDDPTGTDNLSAVDILSTCGLVNYFGKASINPTSDAQHAKVEIAPILIHKGTTRLALYGLGNIRDERLGRMFNTPGCITWSKPPDTPDCPQESWLNLFILHQNRVQHGPQAKNCVLESHLPTWMDLVVWGHEHECKPSMEDARNPAAATSGAQVPVILQPGSTVATALSEGEAARKHCFVLEIRGVHWRLQHHALDSQRPFVYDTVALRDVRPSLKQEDQDAISACLEARVEKLIDKAMKSAAEAAKDMLPLVRLKVDYTGFTTINAQRFGQRFVNRVANPHDILTWAKAPVKRPVKDGEKGGAVDPDTLRPEALDQARIEDLIAENLSDKLRLLQEDELALALHSYVDKDEKTAISDYVALGLKTKLGGPTARRVYRQRTTDEELHTALVDALAADAQEVKQAVGRGVDDVGIAGDVLTAAGPAGGPAADKEDDWLLEAEARAEPAPAKGGRKGKATGDGSMLPPTGRVAAKRGSKDGTATQTGARGGKGRGARGKQLGVLETFARATQQAAAASAGGGGGGDGAGPSGATGDGDDMDDDDFVPPPIPETTRRRATQSTPRGRKSAAKRGLPSGSGDDDDDDDAIQDEGGGRDGGGAAGGSSSRARRSSRAAAGAAKRRRLVEADDDGDALSDGDSEYKDGVSDAGEPSDGGSDDDVISDDDDGLGAAKRKRKAPGKPAARVRGSKKATPSKASARSQTGWNTQVRGKGRAGGGSPAGGGASLARAHDDDPINLSSDTDQEPTQGPAAPSRPTPASLTAAAQPQQPQPVASTTTQRVGGRALPSSLAASAGGSQGTQGRAGGGGTQRTLTRTWAPR